MKRKKREMAINDVVVRSESLVEECLVLTVYVLAGGQQGLRWSQVDVIGLFSFSRNNMECSLKNNLTESSAVVQYV